MQPFDFAVKVYNAGLNNLRGRLTEFSGDNPFGSTPAAGIPVTEDSALGLAAFWGCVRYITSGVSLLPWGVFTTVNGGREERRNHRIWSTLRDEPSQGVTANMWRSPMLWNALVTGNALSRITPDGLQFISEHVEMIKLDDGIAYKITRTGEIILAADIFHLRGPSRDGIMGMSVIEFARENLGLSLAAQAFGGAFFGNGTHTGGIYMTDRDPTDDQLTKLRDSLDQNRGAGKAHRARILTRGMTYEPDTIPPQDAEFLETRKFGAREATMWFGVPAHKLNIEEGATAFASREQANIEAVVDALMPWTVRLEQEANLKLLTSRERSNGFYTHINLDAQLRGDIKTRTEGYKVMVRAGLMKPNEARSKEEMPAEPDGNQLVISRDMIPLDRIGDLADSQVDKNTQTQALMPLVVDAMDAIKIRAKQERARGRPLEKTKEFARLRLEPLAAAHNVMGLPFDLEKFIDEGVKDE